MSPLSILCVEITQNYFIWKKKKKAILQLRSET